ncbi:MAG: oligosaccharide flippase family protein [Ignavibacteriae bacterium]|nr:oligosaccharide flippase family protein [Ignavibacteriota bacterium]
MIEKILRLGKEAAIYGLSSIVGRFLNFLLVPFYTNYLLPSEYGVVANLYAYIACVLIVYGYGMEQAYMRFVSSLEYGDTKEHFSTPFLSLMVTSVLFSGAIHLFSSDVSEWIGIDRTQSYFVAYAAWILCFDTLMVVPYASLRMAQKAKVFAALRILHIVLSLALNIVLIVLLGLKAEGVFIANLIASGVTFFILMSLTGKQFVPSFSPKLYRELLRFGLPYIPSGLATVAMQVIDRPILKSLTNDATVGIYQANFRLGVLMMLVVSMFDYAWRPFFLTHARDEGAKELFARVFTYFSVLMVFVFLAVSLFIDDLVRIHIGGGYFFSPAYWSGVEIVPWILLAFIFTGAYANFVVGVNIEKKTKYLPLVTGTGAVVSIGVNFALIPQYGMMGSAYATLAAYVVMAVGMYFVSQRFYPIRYEWGRLFRLAVAGAAVYVLSILWSVEPLSFEGIAVKFLLCVSFVVLVIALKVVMPAELSSTKSAIQGTSQ